MLKPGVYSHPFVFSQRSFEQADLSALLLHYQCTELRHVPQCMQRCKQTGAQSATHAHFAAADHFVAGLQHVLLPRSRLSFGLQRQRKYKSQKSFQACSFWPEVGLHPDHLKRPIYDYYGIRMRCANRNKK